MEIVIYKPESSDLFDFKSPVNAQHQPHLVQLVAFKMDSETGEMKKTFSVPAIKPENWVIAGGAESSHGVSMDHAVINGIPEDEAVNNFLEFVGDCPVYTFGADFMRKIVASAASRFCSEELLESWDNKARHNCLKKMAGQHIVGKPPTLVQAFNHFTGQGLTGTLDARANADACMTIYFAMNPVKAQKPE